MRQFTSNFSGHMLLMMLGCLMPIAALAIILLLGIPVSQTVLFALLLLCPLSHVLMMAFMLGRHRDDHA